MDVLWLALNMMEVFWQCASLHSFFYKQRQAEIGKKSSKCFATP